MIIIDLVFVLVLGLEGLVLVLVLVLGCLVLVLVLGLECLVLVLVLGLEGQVLVNITVKLLDIIAYGVMVKAYRGLLVPSAS